ncbi:hypothetical protein ACFPK9_12710 [Rubritalea spongiae]|uniref:Uncharacterized protein n=1 Tax=Rubritalea spongiae TaxID=430797 RepID=A0ABW5E1V3_9BACT
MKSFILSAGVVAAFVGISSCEKHDWDKTQKLYESHDEHGHDDHGHGHSDAAHDDHSHDHDHDHKDEEHTH